jgi:hypothetical protein
VTTRRSQSRRDQSGRPRRGQQRGSLHLDRRAERLFEELEAHGPDERLLSTKEAAYLFGQSPEWFEGRRHKRLPPKFVRITARVVKYRLGDLRNFIKSRVIELTGGGGE